MPRDFGYTLAGCWLMLLVLLILLAPLLGKRGRS